MPDDPTPMVFGGGGPGRLYPELPEDRRTAILEGFNRLIRPFFRGVMGFRVVDVRQGYARVARASTTYMIKPAG